VAKKVNAGDSFEYPAGFFNDQVDAVNWIKSQQLNRARDALRRYANPGLIRIKNTTASLVDRFGALGISGVLIDEDTNPRHFKALPTLTGTTPTTADHTGKFVILQEPIRAGKIGVAIVSGLTVAKLNVGDADHEFADVKNSDTGEIRTAIHGAAQILWKESGTGAGKWGLVRIGRGVGPASHIKCQVDGDVADSDETIDVDNVTIMLPEGATTYPGTGTTAPTSLPNSHAGALDDDSWIEAIWDQHAGAWIVIAGNCPA